LPSKAGKTSLSRNTTASFKKNHAKKSFREEYIELLEKFAVDYDRRYIFKTGGE